MKTIRQALLMASLCASILGLGSTQAESADLAVVVDPTRHHAVDTVRDILADIEYDLGPMEWSNGQYSVYLATGRTDSSPHLAGATIRSASIPGVFTAGELLLRNDDLFHIASGRIMVEFQSNTPREAVDSWAASQGLSVLEQMPHARREYLIDAPVSASHLIGLQRIAGTDPVVRIVPLVHTIGAHRLPTWPTGVSHSIPRERNILGVVLKGTAADWTAERGIAQTANAINLEDWDSELWMLKFVDEATLIQTEKDLQQSPDVVHIGAAVSVDPPALLDGHLAVKYRQPTGPIDLAVTLDSEGLALPRVLPYVSNGFLYRHSGYGYSIYDTVHSLMETDGVHYAVPNLFIPSRNAGEDDCAVITGHGYHDYLRSMNMCEAWEIAEAWHNETNIAMLDEGVYAEDSKGLACSELDIDFLVNFETVSECDPASPAIPWCKACIDIARQGGDHGLDVGLAIGADHTDQRILGVNPDADLISARRYILEDNFGLSTQVHYADALLWLAGGDPNWFCDSMYDCDGSTMPGKLSDEYQADVINLSFAVEDFLERDCVDGPGNCGWDEDCIVVCDGLGSCGPVEDALMVLRNPALFPDTTFDQSGVREQGVVVVAAVGNYGSDPTDSCSNPVDVDYPCYFDTTSKPFSSWHQHTDLAASNNTIAIGSTYADGKPYSHATGEYCAIQWEGDYLDVMAPLGNGTDMFSDDPKIFFGASSAATAVVSGVASLMLQVNPELTAAQVQCILRKTADTDVFEDIPSWEWAEDCEVDSGYSRCVGYGMVDAYRAVLAAQACGDPYLTLAYPMPAPEGLVSHLEPSESSYGLPELPDTEEIGDSLDPFSGDKELLKEGTGLSLPFIDAIKPNCPCPVDEEPTGPELLMEYELAPRIYSGSDDDEEDEGFTIDEEAVRILECIANGKCTCLIDPDCIQFRLVNEHEDIWHDVLVRACIEEHCWDLPGKYDDWLPGQSITVPMVIDEMIPAMWRATGQLPVLKVYGQGQLIPPGVNVNSPARPSSLHRRCPESTGPPAMSNEPPVPQ